MNDLRKGFKYLLEALSILEATIRSEDLEKIVIVVVSNEVSNEFEKLKFKKHKINYIKDYRLLSLLYQATDLYVNSSIEDSGPMMVSEALACGTPVVGFDTGVITNMVIDDYNGYKIPMANSHKLAEGILKILKLNTEQYQMFSDNAVKQVKEYSSFEYAKEIFSKILN
ncbi:glycosyltransferase [Elizabethkingia bruuniana]|nr:glycosyltransferase [Elizabethkingia bruuniana]QDZ63612.1 glycosyltransferase [Elizabethkingia bruuniana]